MTAQHLLAVSAAGLTLAVAAPASAQSAPEMTYEEQTVMTAPVLPPMQAAPGATYEYEYDYDTAPYPGPYPGSAPAPMPMPQGSPVLYPPQMPHSAPQIADFDRAAWLDECYERTRGTSGKKKGGIIGGLLGAIAGGVVGNRAWDSERLAGTLVGAGVGGIAGAVIGGAIGKAGDKDRYDCEAYLDRYLAGYGQYGYGYPGHYTYGYAMMPVPVRMVQVTYAEPQRAVVREYVTEEWVDEPVTEYVPAPPPARRVIPAKPVMVKEIKSKPVKVKRVKDYKTGK